MRSLLAVVLTGVFAGYSSPPASAQRNVLLIIADDLGIDRVAAYGAHPDPGHTPNIDALAAQGVLFRNAYSDPLCSVTRANMLTGRYAFRTGVADVLNLDLTHYELGLDEVTIPEMLPPYYRSAAIGKWHLTTNNLTGPAHPLLQGFDHHAGTLGTMTPPENYYDFDKLVDGQTVHVTRYATTDTVNDAIGWIRNTSEPWFVWLAFNAPHSPWHKPPTALHSFELPDSVAENIAIHNQAAIEAMDTEIGRLFASIDADVLQNTVVLFVGDNGTASQATTAPYTPAHAKGKVYEGGIHVPLIVAGSGVTSGAECHALVNTTDLFATVLEIAGGDATSGVDSISIAPYFSAPASPSRRTLVHAALYEPPGYFPGAKHLRTVRDRRFKLLRNRYDAIGVDALEMYDVAADPFELNDLLAGTLTPAQQTAYDALLPQLESHVPPWALDECGIPGRLGALSFLGDGPLLPDEPFSLVLRRGRPDASALLAYGISAAMLPLFGGLLVPDLSGPAAGLVVTATNSGGKIDIDAVWPANVPTGTTLFLQFWVQDDATPYGWSASNGLEAIAP